MRIFFESVWQNAYVLRLDLSLYSHLKECGENGVRNHVNSKGKSPLPEKFSSERDRTHDTASSRPASPTHYQQAIPVQIVIKPKTSSCILLCCLHCSVLHGSCGIVRYMTPRVKKLPTLCNCFLSACVQIAYIRKPLSAYLPEISDTVGMATDKSIGQDCLSQHPILLGLMAQQDKHGWSLKYAHNNHNIHAIYRFENAQ